MNIIIEEVRTFAMTYPAAYFIKGTIIKFVGPNHINLSNPYRIVTDGGLVHLHSGEFVSFAEIEKKWQYERVTSPITIG